jgi:hypothetical protein
MKTNLAENLRPVEIKKKISGIRIGHFQCINEEGQVLVDFPGNQAGPLAARFANSIKGKLQLLGRAADEKILIVFENDDPRLPIIIDIVCEAIEMPEKADDITLRTTQADEVYVDGRRLTFDVREQIELRCGKASITLTRAGKVLIRGAYLLSRSSGVNRIKGGSVQLN